MVRRGCDVRRCVVSAELIYFLGELRPIAPAYLSRVIELSLNSLVSLSLPHDSASVEKLSTALADEHEAPNVELRERLSCLNARGRSTTYY